MLKPGIAAIYLLSIGGSNFSGESGFAVLHLCPSLNFPKLPLCPGRAAAALGTGGALRIRSHLLAHTPKFPVFGRKPQIPSFCPQFQHSNALPPVWSRVRRRVDKTRDLPRALLQTSHQSHAELSQSLARRWQVLLQHWVILVPVLVPEQWVMKQPIVQELARAEHPPWSRPSAPSSACSGLPEGLLVQSCCC